MRKLFIIPFFCLLMFSLKSEAQTIIRSSTTKMGKYGPIEILRRVGEEMDTSYILSFRNSDYIHIIDYSVTSINDNDLEELYNSLKIFMNDHANYKGKNLTSVLTCGFRMSWHKISLHDYEIQFSDKTGKWTKLTERVQKKLSDAIANELNLKS